MLRICALRALQAGWFKRSSQLFVARWLSARTCAVCARNEARLPARIAVLLDLRQIGERRSDMADRGQFVKAAGAVGAKPRVTKQRAAARLVNVDVGTDHQNQRTGSIYLARDHGLGEHLPQRGLPGRIVGLLGTREVEEQVHELGRRRVSVGGLRRCRRGEERQDGHEPKKPDISHSRDPPVALARYDISRTYLKIADCCRSDINVE